eukprot:351002-Rhodomonas_salina.1
MRCELLKETCASDESPSPSQQTTPPHNSSPAATAFLAVLSVSLDPLATHQQRCRFQLSTTGGHDQTSGIRGSQPPRVVCILVCHLSRCTTSHLSNEIYARILRLCWTCCERSAGAHVSDWLSVLDACFVGVSEVLAFCRFTESWLPANPAKLGQLVLSWRLTPSITSLLPAWICVDTGIREQQHGQ